MTRIFDALRKAKLAEAEAEAFTQSTASPIHHPTPASIHPGAMPAAAVQDPPPARPSPRALARPEIQVVEAAAIPEDIQRELQGLRIGIEAALGAQGPKTVMFTSPQGGEGTSTVAAQFALMLAGDSRARTLLLDLHARRPAIAERFGLDDSFAAPPSERPLAVGRVPREIVTLGFFSPTSVRERLAAVAPRFDWIVLDGPPLLEAAESVELAGLADGVVLVVQAGGTKRPVVTRAVELLRKSGARVLGSVLNRRRLEIPDFIYRRL